MFHYDNGLFCTPLGLAVDVPRRQAWGFVSHAHADHTGRHERILCTPATAALLQHRIGDRPRYETLEYGQPRQIGPCQLTLVPAGHILGSAMLLVEQAGRRYLYTGDFCLDEGMLAEPAQLPRADVLIMECTFGEPHLARPPRRVLEQQLVDLVQRLLRLGMTPVLMCYTVGKAQAVTRRLTAAGIAVLQHPAIYEISRIYERLGVSLGTYSRLDADIPTEGAAVVLPPPTRRMPGIARPLPRRVTIAVTGWAGDPGSRGRLHADRWVGLSDHADFTQLLACVRRVQPQRVYCTHGSPGLVDCLRAAGWESYWLAGCTVIR